MTIVNKDTEEFIGHVVVGGSEEPNSSETAMMIRED